MSARRSRPRPTSRGIRQCSTSSSIPIASDRSVFSIRPSLARLGLRVVTVLRFMPPGGTVRAFDTPAIPGWCVSIRAGTRRRGGSSGSGRPTSSTRRAHLLFLLCLVIPLRRPRELILTVTAFTAGHSVTLIAAALNAGPDGLWFPPLVETLIAASMIPTWRSRTSCSRPAKAAVRLPWAAGAGSWRSPSGLVHGLGFSFALRESLQFAGSHLLTSLLSFNAGVELGQLLVLDADGPALQLLLASSWLSGSARSCCPRSSRTPHGTGPAESVGQPASVRVAGLRRRSAGVARQVRDGARGRGRCRLADRRAAEGKNAGA